jgi:hypothetical protein
MLIISVAALLHLPRTKLSRKFMGFRAFRICAAGCFPHLFEGVVNFVIFPILFVGIDGLSSTSIFSAPHAHSWLNLVKLVVMVIHPLNDLHPPTHIP